MRGIFLFLLLAAAAVAAQQDCPCDTTTCFTVGHAPRCTPFSCDHGCALHPDDNRCECLKINAHGKLYLERPIVSGKPIVRAQRLTVANRPPQAEVVIQLLAAMVSPPPPVEPPVDPPQEPPQEPPHEAPVAPVLVACTLHLMQDGDRVSVQLPRECSAATRFTSLHVLQEGGTVIDDPMVQGLFLDADSGRILARPPPDDLCLLESVAWSLESAEVDDPDCLCDPAQWDMPEEWTWPATPHATIDAWGLGAASRDAAASPPEDAAFGCTADAGMPSAPPAAVPVWSEGSLHKEFHETADISSTCAGRFAIRRSWNAKDLCGRTTTHTQTLAFSDTVAPTLGLASHAMTVCVGPPMGNHIVRVVQRLPELLSLLMKPDLCDQGLSYAVIPNGRCRLQPVSGDTHARARELDRRLKEATGPQRSRKAQQLALMAQQAAQDAARKNSDDDVHCLVDGGNVYVRTAEPRDRWDSGDRVYVATVNVVDACGNERSYADWLTILVPAASESGCRPTFGNATHLHVVPRLDAVTSPRDVNRVVYSSVDIVRGMEYAASHRLSPFVSPLAIKNGRQDTKETITTLTEMRKQLHMKASH